MTQLAQSESPVPRLGAALPSLGEDRRWLTVLATLTGIELLWWTVCWSRGIAPAPFLGSYLVLAAASLAGALALRKAFWGSPERSGWPSILLGTALVAVGASLFLPLKFAIPGAIPFWLDVPLADWERAAFGGDPWRVLDRLLGWAAVPVDRLYGLWLPVQSLVLFAVILQPPSPAKSRALIAYSIGWFALGVVAATLLSSAGPIFFDRLLGGSQFAPLHETLRSRGAWMVLAESDAMWESLASGHAGFVAGISAVPSLHVAISLWIYLTARTLARRAAPFALAYVIFMWVGSVQLGWHYVTDGLAGVLGMLAVWSVARRLARQPARPIMDTCRP